MSRSARRRTKTPKPGNTVLGRLLTYLAIDFGVSHHQAAKYLDRDWDAMSDIYDWHYLPHNTYALQRQPLFIIAYRDGFTPAEIARVHGVSPYFVLKNMPRQELLPEDLDALS